jgi:hypothetical protein
LEQLNVPLDRASLARLETGRRGVSLNEFMAISAALGAAPANMLIPLDDECDVTISAEHTLSPTYTRQWVRGDFPLDPSDATTYFGVEVPTFEQESRRRCPEASAIRQAAAALADSPKTELLGPHFDLIRDHLKALETRRRVALREQERTEVGTWVPMTSAGAIRRPPPTSQGKDRH